MQRCISLALSTLRTTILGGVGAVCMLAAGCAQPMGVRVVDSVSRQPIVNASVTRYTLLRPYFIVSAFVPTEECVTNAEGLVSLKDRDGSLEIHAAGYKDAHKSLEQEDRVVVVELERADDESD